VIRVLGRQQLTVSPKGRSPAFESLERKGFGCPFEVVSDEKWFSAFNAEVLQNAGFMTKPAISAFKMGYVH
jgi:hypothetical protein